MCVLRTFLIKKIVTGKLFRPFKFTVFLKARISNINTHELTDHHLTEKKYLHVKF